MAAAVVVVVELGPAELSVAAVERGLAVAGVLLEKPGGGGGTVTVGAELELATVNNSNKKHCKLYTLVKKFTIPPHSQIFF